jgi:hypothetical protein
MRGCSEWDFCWWALPSGQRARVTWHHATGVLYVWYPTEDADDGEPLAHVRTLADCRRLVEGLDPDDPDSLFALRERVEKKVA